MMKILIVEDEIHIARHLKKQVLDLLGDDGTEIYYSSRLEEAFELLDKHKMDLVLLDLNLKGKDGFELLKLVTAGSFHTIVVSAYKERAIEAFEYGVIDFLPKPFSKARLEKALNRLQDVDTRPDYPIKYFAIKKRGKLHLVEDDQVVYFEAYGHYSKIHQRDGSVEVHDKSLGKLFPLLGEVYERVHKSYIVKMSEVTDLLVYEGGKYELELKNGEIIPLGRTKYKMIKEKWLS